MYEHFRNEFQCAAEGQGIGTKIVTDVLHILDQLAERYEIQRKESSLMPYNEEMPEIVKIYIVCKKIAGLSQETLDAYTRTLGLFFRTVRKPMAKITANDIRVYLYSYQQERGCSNRSLDKYRQYLSSFFSWAADEGYTQSNPMRTIPAIKYEHKPRKNLTQLELEYLRQACRTSREQAIIETLFSTGCRVSELAGLEKSDVDWNTVNDIEYICDCLSEAEILAQLAEEATELAHAALKLRRTLSNDNPTPVNHDDALKNMIEEFADVALCAAVLGMDEYISDMEKIAESKASRWAQRLENADA